MNQTCHSLTEETSTVPLNKHTGVNAHLKTAKHFNQTTTQRVHMVNNI